MVVGGGGGKFADVVAGKLGENLVELAHKLDNVFGCLQVAERRRASAGLASAAFGDATSSQAPLRSQAHLGQLMHVSVRGHVRIPSPYRLVDCTQDQSRVSPLAQTRAPGSG